MSRWTRHVKEWKTCTRCPLHKTRTKVVLAKGYIPCDVLFIGEAPGPSEDVIGSPFVGPAGILLDKIIEAAAKNWEEEQGELRKAFTNLIACIPLDPEGVGKFSEPPAESIKACAPRILEFVSICKPRLIVHVGKLAAEHTTYTEEEQIHITHPAAILRTDVGRKGLMLQTAIVTLRDALEEL